MKSKNIKRFQPLSFRLIILSFVSLILILVAIFAIYSLFVKNGQTTKLLDNSSIQIVALQKDLEETRKVLFNLEISDQIKVNNELNTEIKNIQKTFNEAVVVYEDIVDLRVAKINTQKIDEKFSTILKSLADKKYTDAETKITETRALIKTENDKLTASTIASVSTANLTSSNSTPDSGYRRQQVSTDIGSFVVDIVTADLGSTKVIVDTASDGDCRNDCPVMSVGNYASRSGAYAAINGSYFCPASYPSCSDKKNSFDTLLMNKNKTYFNSDNNVYSTVPAVIFSSQSRFVSQSLEWGRDTSVDGVIANQPLLTHNGQLLFGVDSDAKKTSKANRSVVV